MILRFLVLLLIIGLDRAVKVWAENYLRPVHEMDFIPGLVSFTYAQNSGAAFGMLKDMRWFFVIVTVVVLALILLAFTRNWLRHPVEKWSLIMIAGGAIGNLIDRAYQGYVVDMFSFDFINFAIFNVADIFVSVGGVALCVYLIFFHRSGKKRR